MLVNWPHLIQVCDDVGDKLETMVLNMDVIIWWILSALFII